MRWTALSLAWLWACGAPGVATSPAPAAPAVQPSTEPLPEPDAALRPAAEPKSLPAGAVRAGDPCRRTPPAGWVDLMEAVPGLLADARYHTPDNFTEGPVAGYGVPGVWLREEAAVALALVQQDLATKGYGLLVYDAYRPLRGTLAMVAWAERTDQVALLDGGYIARRSGHNKGHTIDLTVVHAASGQPLDMGTPWDTLSEASHTRNATGVAAEHRAVLKTAMSRHGFKNYWREWWHYTWEGAPGAAGGAMRHRDVPYAVFEPDEGVWKAPAGWNKAGWTAPAWPSSPPCRVPSATQPQ